MVGFFYYLVFFNYKKKLDLRGKLYFLENALFHHEMVGVAYFGHDILICIVNAMIFINNG